MDLRHPQCSTFECNASSWRATLETRFFNFPWLVAHPGECVGGRTLNMGRAINEPKAIGGGAGESANADWQTNSGIIKKSLRESRPEKFFAKFPIHSSP